MLKKGSKDCQSIDLLSIGSTPVFRCPLFSCNADYTTSAWVLQDDPLQASEAPEDHCARLISYFGSLTEPSMIAVSWMDNRPVHFIATGCSIGPVMLSRRDGADVVDVPAPHLVKDYLDGMGGAAIRDQLRLQRYSIQVYFVLMNLTLYSPYRVSDRTIVTLCYAASNENEKVLSDYFSWVDRYGVGKRVHLYRCVQADRAPGKTPPTHAEYMLLMQIALLSVGAVNFEDDLSVRNLTDTPVPHSPTLRYTLPGRHTTKQVEIFRVPSVKHGKETRNAVNTAARYARYFDQERIHGRPHSTA
ncbi:hypothetical protein PHMEG_0006796 [Phytophthora megakarya]|uniref:PiggyBac transposable element-derived protein domain-containing protein n=1 Tax=Phytophthora megakarya TaxID=4795 RepID=A0A225WNX5_9STRA|nr:hypothetical protein PHMEG_0006796 [Phytophthora megakarya]